MSWEAVPQAEVAAVISATQEGRCASCYGAISSACPGEHAFYCCDCDDNDACSKPGKPD
jgi:hypothetical protein